MNTVLTIAFKDLRQSFRSAFLLGMMLAAPLLITGLIYFAFGGFTRSDTPASMAELRVIMVNQDQPAADSPALGDLVVSYMQDERMPDWLTVSVENDPAAARATVQNGAAGVAVIIPSDFSAALQQTDQTASLTLVHDPTLTIGPMIVESLLRQFVDGVSGARIAASTISAAVASTGQAAAPEVIYPLAGEFAAWFGEYQTELHHSTDPLTRPINVYAPSDLLHGGQNAQAPMQMIMAQIMAGMLIFFAFFSAASAAESILTEEENHTLARLFTTPLPRALVIGGKLLAVIFTVLVQVAVLLAASALLFNIRWGSPLSLAAAALGLTVSAAGFGLLLLSFARNTRQAGALIGAGLTLSGMLGGLFTVGVRNLPPLFNTFTLIMPQGWAMKAFRLALNGAGLSELLVPMLVMIAMGSLLFALGAMRFNKRFQMA